MGQVPGCGEPPPLLRCESLPLALGQSSASCTVPLPSPGVGGTRDPRGGTQPGWGAPNNRAPCPTVVYVCCSPDTFRQLMLEARREGLTRGDYVFFYIDIFGASLQGTRFPESRQPWQRRDKHDASAREAYKVWPSQMPGFSIQGAWQSAGWLCQEVARSAPGLLGLASILGWGGRCDNGAL